MVQNKELYPLTSAQMSCIMSQVYSLEPLVIREAITLGAYFMVPKDCDFDALEKAFNGVIERNDALRLRIVHKGLRLRQYIADYEPRKLELVTIGDSQEAIDEYLSTAYQHHLKLFDSDLVWAQMARTGTGGILLMRLHHICTDGYSLNLVFKALERYYDRIVETGCLPEEKTYSITKYFASYQKYLNSKQFEKDKAFWKKALNTQRDYKFPLGHRSEFSASDNERITISGELYQKLSSFCHDNNCTMQAAVMSIAAMMTYAEKGALNFAFGPISHNRTTPGLRQTIGCIMESYLLFFDIDTTMSINEFAQDTYTSNLEHLSHAKIPLNEQNKYIFKEAIKHGFNFFHQWLMISSMDLAKTADEMRYPAAQLPEIRNCTQVFCTLYDVPEQSLDIMLTYQTHKFKRKQILYMFDTFCRLAEIALEDPTRSVEEVCNKLKEKRS